MRSIGVGLVVLCLASCSVYADGQQQTVTVAEPLVNHEQCDSARPNLVVSGGSYVVEGDRYGSEACAKALLVDVISLPDQPAAATIRWSAPKPANPVDCANASLSCHSWQDGVPADNLVSRGAWFDGACTVADLHTPPFGKVGSSVTRRYAISALQGSDVRDVQLAANLLAGIGGGPGVP